MGGELENMFKNLTCVYVIYSCFHFIMWMVLSAFCEGETGCVMHFGGEKNDMHITVGCKKPLGGWLC